MNNNTLINCVVFAAGAAIGSAVTWKLLKTKYEQLAQEEIDSVKEVFANREPLEKVVTVETNIPEKPDLMEYAARLKDQGYTNKEEEADEDVDIDKPYVIAPEEFGEMVGYDTESLTYYADGVLTDDNDDIIEDVDDIVGEDSLTHFGEYEEDSVFVRNDARKCDYEILKDLRNYYEDPQ